MKASRPEDNKQMSRAVDAVLVDAEELATRDGCAGGELLLVFEEISLALAHHKRITGRDFITERTTASVYSEALRVVMYALPVEDRDLFTKGFEDAIEAERYLLELDSIREDLMGIQRRLLVIMRYVIAEADTTENEDLHTPKTSCSDKE